MTTILNTKGKSQRTEWWVTTLISGLIAQLALIFALEFRYKKDGANWFTFAGLMFVVGLAIWSAIAVTARQFRDHGNSPWMALLLALPYIGALVVLVICGFQANPLGQKTRLSVKLTSSNPIKKCRISRSSQSTTAPFQLSFMSPITLTPSSKLALR